jgi:fructose-bisphosphate aldolase class II
MISWGLQVNEYGNAFQDDQGNFVKVTDKGATDSMWKEMVEYANSKSIKGGDYKKLNLPFENRLFGQSQAVRDRMVKGVEDFVYDILVHVFNARDTAPLAIDAILKAGSFDLGPKGRKIENKADWTPEKIAERALKLAGDKGSGGNFDD